MFKLFVLIISTVLTAVGATVGEIQDICQANP